MKNRSGGILLHITSLPGKEGIGTLGENAFRFIDFLSETGLKWWQILPIGPIGYGDSPYQCYSAFAGNPLLIDLELLGRDGLLEKEDFFNIPRFNASKVEFARIGSWKFSVLRKAYTAFRENSLSVLVNGYGKFITENEWWLNDYTLFMAAKKHFRGLPWNEWANDLKFREGGALEKYNSLLDDEVNFRKFLQFTFFRQWSQLKEYAQSKYIGIFGDVPLYVSTDSVDVWANPDIFSLDRNLKPLKVGGVPPDYFSASGQLWGNPVFNWDRIRERDFDWWMARLHFNLKLYDIVRIDHFRGLESFWSVDANEPTAEKGEWVKARGMELLQKLKQQVEILPFVAEDLGVITPEVEKLREKFHLPGMKILQFAFSSDGKNEYLPHNYGNNCVVYTGTHDNDTTFSWYRKAGKKEKKLVKTYLRCDQRSITQKMIEMAWSSVADTAIVPLQDVFELGGKARMNLPGTPSGNWGWRFRWKDLNGEHKKFLKEINKKYNRQREDRESG